MLTQPIVSIASGMVQANVMKMIAIHMAQMQPVHQKQIVFGREQLVPVIVKNITAGLGTLIVEEANLLVSVTQPFSALTVTGTITRVTQTERVGANKIIQQ